MSPQICLVALLILSAANGEKATSYVSVSKGKEGGYSYEVIHDYPTKDSTASVHVFSDEDFDRAPDVSYDYGANFAADVAKLAVDAERSLVDKNRPRGRGKKQNFESSPYPGNDFNNLNHVKQTPGNGKAAAQLHSSAYFNIEHNTRAQTTGARVKSQGVASYSYDVGNSVFPKGTATFHSGEAPSDHKGGTLDTGGIRGSASGPGFSFADPTAVRGAPGDFGPVIYHHHHYHGDGSKDYDYDRPKAGYRQNDAFGSPPPTRNGAHQHISIEATLGHTCATGEVTPLPHFHPRKPDDGFFNYARDYGYGAAPDSQLGDINGYDYPTPVQSFPTPPKNNHNGAKKGKWKPVIITSSEKKGKLHTFRISKDFKPGKLMGGFKPSYGPPGHHKAAAHLKSFGHLHVDKDPFAAFHDAPFFDYDSILASLENNSADPPPSGSFDVEFPDYNVASGEKSLKDYHNSLYPDGGQRRRSKKIALKPIVVAPLKTTTVHSTTTVTSPDPGVHVTSFVDSRPLIRATPRKTSAASDDQSTSYANPNKSLKRNNKRKNG